MLHLLCATCVPGSTTHIYTHTPRTYAAPTLGVRIPLFTAFTQKNVLLLHWEASVTLVNVTP